MLAVPVAAFLAVPARVVQVPGRWTGREGRRVPLCWPWRDPCHPVPLRSWFEGQGLAGKLRAIQTVSCLLQGPCEAGNRALELSGVMESVIALCASEQEEEQLVAVEALIHAAGKAKRASFITANGVSLLKDLYKRSEKDSIRIRALVVSWAGLGWAGQQAGYLLGGRYVRVWLQHSLVKIWDMQGLVEARGVSPGSFYHWAHGQVRDMSLVQRGPPRKQDGTCCPLEAVGEAPGGDDGGDGGPLGQASGKAQPPVAPGAGALGSGWPM